LHADESDLAEVRIVDDEKEAKSARKAGAIAFQRAAVFSDLPAAKSSSKAGVTRQHTEDQMTSIMQILDAFGLLRGLSYARQQELLNAIATVLVDSE
jgi:hypothetical protein